MAGGRTSPWPWCAGAALFLGVVLRTFALREQIPCDDEMWSVRPALSPDYRTLFGVYNTAYYSIPHELILKALADGLGLDELTLRLPSLIPGLALLIAAPALAWRRFGAATAALFAALLAISPALVLHSRFARAYGFAIALVFFAVLALERWLATRRPSPLLGYVGCATAAIWFHQLTAPAVLAPLVVAAWLSARDVAPAQRARELAAPLLLGCGVALISLALQWDAVVVSSEQLWGKVGLARIGAMTLLGVASLLAGSRELWLIGAFWIGAAFGWAFCLRHQPRIASLMLASLVAQFAAVWMLAPWLAEIPRIFARYVVCTLPFVLLFLALGLAEFARVRLVGRDWPLPLLAGLVLVALLYFLGPLPAIYYRPNNFTTHARFQDAPWEKDPGTPPPSEFYTRLRQEPGDFAIVETPWQNSPALIPYYAYQRLHAKRVRIGFLGALLDPPNPDEISLRDPRVAFRTFVDVADPEALRAAQVRYVVVHRKLAAELGFPGHSIDLDAVIPELERRLGRRVYEDAGLVVFAVSSPMLSATPAAPAPAPGP